MNEIELKGVSDNWMWEAPLAENFGNDLSTLSGRSILIIGAGDTLLAEKLNEYGASIYLIDKNFIKSSSNITMICVGNNEAIPFIDNFFDIAISCSTFQYVSHRKVFNELSRVSKKNALVLLNENKAFNPFIILYRGIRRLKSFSSRGTQDYISRIQGYLSKNEIPADKFSIERINDYYFFSALNFIYRKPIPLFDALDKALKKVKMFQALFWFTTYRLRVIK